MSVPKITPLDLGITNPKFAQFRPQQLEALGLVHSCFESDSEQIPMPMLSIPTGGGKYLIGFAVGKQYAEMGFRTLILTHSKGLQDQAELDSTMDGLQIMKGRNNYDCIEQPGSNCEIGGLRGCGAGSECPAAKQKEKCSKAQIVLANYAYYLTVNRHLPGQNPIGEFGVVVCDEAHLAPKLLSNALTVTLIPAELPKKYPEQDLGFQLLDTFPTLLEAPPPRAHITQKVQDEVAENVNRMKQWAAKSLPIAIAFQKEAIEKLREEKSQTALDMQKKGGEILESLKLLNSMNVENWVVDMPRSDGAIQVTGPQNSKEIIATPLSVAPYAHYLFNKTPFRILMSATLIQGTGASLGVAKQNTKFKEWGRVFPTSRNPVYNWGQVALSATTEKDISAKATIVRQILAIIQQYDDCRGIVHTVSYGRMEWLYHELSKHESIRDRLMVHKKKGKYHNYESGQEVVERYLNDDNFPVLFSPVLSTGWDFPDDACRFIIIPKLPFAPNNDLASRFRKQVDKNYGLADVVVEVTQMCGRGSRHIEDWCACYMLDSSWSKWFEPATRYIRPKSLIVQNVLKLPERIRF